MQKFGEVKFYLVKTGLKSTFRVIFFSWAMSVHNEILRSGDKTSVGLAQAHPNYSEKLRNLLVLYRMRHRCTSHPKLKSQPIALQCTSNWNTFVHLSVLVVRTILLKTFYQYSHVLADFHKFHWTSEVYATLTMRNRFLGVQMSLLWVVFAIKIVTLLWQPAKSWDIARERPSSTAICCWNVLIILIMISKGPQLIS